MLSYKESDDSSATENVRNGRCSRAANQTTQHSQTTNQTTQHSQTTNQTTQHSPTINQTRQQGLQIVAEFRREVAIGANHASGKFGHRSNITILLEGRAFLLSQA